MRRLSQSSGIEAASPHLPNGMVDIGATRCKYKVDNTGKLPCIVTAELLRLALIKTYFVSTRKQFEHKINKLAHKISHQCRKTMPIFTTFTHNTSLNSLNKHMCCDLLMIARTHQTEKCGFSPTAATLPEILCLQERQQDIFCKAVRITCF